MPLFPIVERELRVASRRLWTHWLRFFAGLALILLFAILMLSSRANSPARVGHDVFLGMTMLILGLCLLCGLFLTADALSEEKREGTIGLLFLTPLRSYDVVLGKLASSSFQAIFALLSVFPVLAVPLLMGGVTGSEFVRILLVLVVTIFFSLGLGLLASSVSVEARQALSRTLLLIVLFAGFAPLIWFALGIVHLSPRAGPLLWGSPVFAFVKGLDPMFNSPTSRHDFVCSVIVLSMVAVLAGWIACIKVRGSIRSGWEGARDLRAQDRIRLRVVKLPVVLGNPIYWLTESRCAVRKWWNRMLWVAVPIWLLFLVHALQWKGTAFPTAFFICLAVIYGLHQILKIVMTIEVTRRFSEDRQSGALELMLVSPLRVAEIVDGHVRAMWRRFNRPIVSLAILNLIFISMILAFPKSFPVEEDVAGFCGSIAAAILLLILDFRAFLWLGMWRALVARRHHRAVLMTLGMVMFLPWFLIFLAFAGVGDAIGSALSFTTVSSSWFALCVGIDVVITRRAKRRITMHFRDLAVAQA